MILRTQLYRLMIYQSKNNYLLLILFVISDTIMEKFIINNFFNILINNFLFNFYFLFYQDIFIRKKLNKYMDLILFY